MKTLKQYSHQLVTAATPLPIVVRKSGLVKLWLLSLSRERIYLLAGLLFLVFAINPISRGLVNIWYPPEAKTLSNTISGILNTRTHRSARAVRETRYQQLVILFWSLGLSVAVIVLILDLPDAVKRGEKRAQKLLQQSDSVKSTNPELATTLANTAYQFLLQDTPENLTHATRGRSSSISNSTEVARTVALSTSEKSVRFVGDNKRYRIDKAISSGGSGVVYLAFDTVLERKVALKELFEDLMRTTQHADRFKVEAKALASLNHPHVLPIYDFLQEGGHFWLVMELLGGGDLIGKIDRVGTLSMSEGINITRKIASGLGYAHDKGFIHRDIKPENILFADDGSLRIIDFGIAKHGASTIKTQQGIVMGSPGYMSPEQAAGENIDARSDIYSLGVTLYQMLTGCLPFDGDSAAVLAQHITRKPTRPSELNPDISVKMEAIILKMLKKKPSQRYQSTKTLITALDGLKLT